MAEGWVARISGCGRWVVGAAIALALLASSSASIPHAAAPAGGAHAPGTAARTESRAAWELARVLDEAERSGASPTCFHEQLEASPWGDAIGRASVSLSVLDGGGKVVGFGSGMVVRGSGMPGDPHNRIVTARHVSDPLAAGPGRFVSILSSAGVTLGSATLAAIADPAPMEGAVRGGDVAVLRMTSFPGGDPTGYDAIEGMDLAPVQSRAVLTMEASGPGIGIGASGGGVVAADGLMGVVTSRLPDLPGPAVELPFVRIEEARKAGSLGAAVRPLSLPVQSRGYMEPLRSPAVLAALNGAGAQVSVSEEPLPAMEAVVAAFPGGGCVAYEGTVEAYVPGSPAHRSSLVSKPGLMRWKRDGSTLEFDWHGRLGAMTLPDGTRREF